MASAATNADLIQQVKARLPKLAITKKDLEAPTKKFVCDFFNSFLEKYSEYMNFLSKRDFPLISNMHLNYLRMNHNPEAITFHTMKKFFKPVDVSFFIEDIYSPSKERTKRLIQICIHFIGFLNDVILDKYNFDETFDLLESFKQLQYQETELRRRCEEIIIEVGKKNIELNDITKYHQNILDELKKVEMAYEEKNNKLKAEKSKINTLSVMVQCETLKLETIKTEIKKLEAQIVDENEITSLMNMLNIHKEKKENFMKEYHSKNEQLHKNNIEINHLENCLVELEKLNVHKPTNWEDFRKNSQLLANFKIELDKEEQINDNYKKDIEKMKAAKDDLTLKEKDLNKQMLKKKHEVLEKFDLLELKQNQYIEECKIFIRNLNKKTLELNNGLIKINLEERNIKNIFEDLYRQIKQKETEVNLEIL